ncbi:hypothetical protein [Paenibacillus pinihumi]|uniref:hypothetical protein n=1 Tax=Paenibacillus pinihumi TaxID=669462 RepID=UPI00048D4A3F|nr:hypothetical protein [Paenibacillus pinihumi]
MKKIILSITIVMVLCLVGCSKDYANTVKDEPTQMKKIAWEGLSKKEQKVVVGSWESATIEKIEVSKLKFPLIFLEKNSENIYRVTFKTTQDELLGPIGVYIDADIKKIVGYDIRE